MAHICSALIMRLTHAKQHCEAGTAIIAFFTEEHLGVQRD